MSERDIVTEITSFDLFEEDVNEDPSIHFCMISTNIDNYPRSPYDDQSEEEDEQILLKLLTQ